MYAVCVTEQWPVTAALIAQFEFEVPSCAPPRRNLGSWGSEAQGPRATLRPSFELCALCSVLCALPPPGDWRLEAGGSTLMLEA